jgi:Secretion system C-terminal sorting domain
MKNTFAVTLLLLALSCIAQGQVTLNFTVNQYGLLAATPGSDTTVKRGAVIRLGSATPATGGSGSYQLAWTPVSGLDSPNTARPLATIDTSITYTLTITDSVTGCIQAAEFGVHLLDSINLRIFPNPTAGLVHLTTDKGFGDPSVTIEVVDVLGRRLSLTMVDGSGPISTTLDMAGKGRGIYFIRILGASTHLTRKLLVK